MRPESGFIPQNLRGCCLALALAALGAAPLAATDALVPEARTLKQLAASDLVLVGTVGGCTTRALADNATQAEIAERVERGDPPGSLLTDCQVEVESVWKGDAELSVVTVIQHGGTWGARRHEVLDHPLLQTGIREVLFLIDVSGDRVYAPGRSGWLLTPGARLRVGGDGRLSGYTAGPVPEGYAGLALADLEDAFQRVAPTAVTPPTREEAERSTLAGTSAVVVGKIGALRAPRLLPAEGKPQSWINQMLAEGKMPGQLITEFEIEVERVICTRSPAGLMSAVSAPAVGDRLRVARWGGTYQGVTQITEPGPDFVTGAREVLFLRDLAQQADDPRYRSGSVVYALIDSALGRFRVTTAGTLSAFSPRGLGAFYAGADLEQLAADLGNCN